ncbi:hypothetical protein J8273_7430 [Carpediemonas membranifera]|uniref:Uncharacterized protein n=1 Tax=Carpediemonas membranifera TaxID=201153 RepID=A0A8J6AQ93_9EUKA|nr:hypothetical protein J8273_7430 [Carpediemonas membranifera]|eukprot:KAG9391156.1 hypothetical protein J8273_7430 [Carpediemonas membranifera]
MTIFTTGPLDRPNELEAKLSSQLEQCIMHELLPQHCVIDNETIAHLLTIPPSSKQFSAVMDSLLYLIYEGSDAAASSSQAALTLLTLDNCEDLCTAYLVEFATKFDQLAPSARAITIRFFCDLVRVHSAAATVLLKALLAFVSIMTETDLALFSGALCQHSAFIRAQGLPIVHDIIVAFGMYAFLGRSANYATLADQMWDVVVEFVDTAVIQQVESAPVPADVLAVICGIPMAHAAWTERFARSDKPITPAFTQMVTQLVPTRIICHLRFMLSVRDDDKGLLRYHCLFLHNLCKRLAPDPQALTRLLAASIRALVVMPGDPRTRQALIANMCGYLFRQNTDAKFRLVVAGLIVLDLTLFNAEHPPPSVIVIGNHFAAFRIRPLISDAMECLDSAPVWTYRRDTAGSALSRLLHVSTRVREVVVAVGRLQQLAARDLGTSTTVPPTIRVLRRDYTIQQLLENKRPV